MTDAPKRIWINKVHGQHPEDWDFTDGECWTKAQLRKKVEYVRADRIEELVAELDLMKTAGIIEIASRNNRVTEYMFHWEGRALDAEAKLAKAMEALREIYGDGNATGCNPQWMTNTAANALAELEKRID